VADVNPFEFLTPKPGMTSIDAANAFIAAERQQEREQAEDAALFDMDELEKAALVRWTGFEFLMTVHKNRIIFTDRTTGLKTTCLFTEPMDEKVGKRMVRSLARLKKLHDEYMFDRKR
jgi:hypothetical protein